MYDTASAAWGYNPLRNSYKGIKMKTKMILAAAILLSSSMSLAAPPRCPAGTNRTAVCTPNPQEGDDTVISDNLEFVVVCQGAGKTFLALKNSGGSGSKEAVVSPRTGATTYTVEDQDTVITLVRTAGRSYASVSFEFKEGWGAPPKATFECK